MAIGWESLDLKKQFTFYASYHNQSVNVAIHLLCIWPILATALLLLQVMLYLYRLFLNIWINYQIICNIYTNTIISSFQYTPAFVDTPSFLQESPYFKDVKINFALVATIIYCGMFNSMHL